VYLLPDLATICSLFIDWQQEDAHEFMKELLSSIHEELNRVKSKPKYKQMFKEVEGESVETMASAFWSY
jgi:ubiquitin C-terminal hydrolase